MRERGSAPAEFALVAGLLCVLVLAAVQLALALHVRNTAVASVVEGARHGARADLSPADGAARARDLLSRSVPGGASVPVTAQESDVAGARIVVVSAKVPLPLLGTFGAGRSMTVTGQAYEEEQ